MRVSGFFHHVAKSWAWFVLSDNIVEVDMQGVQPMRCVMCHSFENSSSLQSSTKSQKGFVTYNPKHGITSCRSMLQMNIAWICRSFSYTKILR
jgi:hypothetical protein